MRFAERAALLVLTASAARAQECPATIAAADTAEGDAFGRACAMDGGRLVVGTFPGNGVGAGAAYLFDLETMTELRRFTEPVPRDASNFGSAVAISGDALVVGAGGAAVPGAIYVFDAGTGVLRHSVAPPDSEAGDAFGDAVSVSGRFALVGGRYRDDADDDSGRAWLVDVESGQVVSLFRPSRGGRGSDRFGASVAIDGELGLIGAPGDDTFGTNAGAVYVVSVTGRRIVRKLFPDGVPVGAQFGESVAIDGALAAVGAFLEDSVGADAGAAYVFDVPSFTQRWRLTLPEGGSDDFFGQRVALRDGTLAVRAALVTRRNGAGSVYVYDARTAERLSQIPADGRASFDNFGIGLAIDAGRIVGGAPGDDDRGADAGEIQVFRIDELPETPIVFDPEPETSVIHIEVSIPGIGTFAFDVRVTGRMLVVAPLDCDPPRTFRTVGMELRPLENPGATMVLPGVTGTVHEPVLTLASAGGGGAVAPDGTFTESLGVRLDGVVVSDSPLGRIVHDFARNPALTVTVQGRLVPGIAPLQVEYDVPAASTPIDLGLGPLNPTLTVSGGLTLVRRPGRQVPASPTSVKRAKVGLVFTSDAGDSASLAGTFDRRLAPPLRATGAVLRIGARRDDVELAPKGRTGLSTVRGASPVVAFRATRRGGTLKVKLPRASLATALAAEPSADRLPGGFAWSLALDDGWNTGGRIVLDGPRRVVEDGDGVVSRASLSTTPLR